MTPTLLPWLFGNCPRSVDLPWRVSCQLSSWEQATSLSELGVFSTTQRVLDQQNTHAENKNRW